MPDNVNLTVHDLKAIIHGLKMSSFNYIEEGAFDEIKAMIKALPSPEHIDKMIESPDNFKNIQLAIGNIMRFIEMYGKRDMEYKVRYKSRTKLPPRYKVLDWRKAMNVKNNIVSGMIDLSEDLDKGNYSCLSDRVLKCAKKLIDDKFDIKEFYSVTRDIVSSVDKGKLVKEAQRSATDYDLDLGDIGQGFENVKAWLNHIGQLFQKKIHGLQGMGENAVPFISNLSQLWSSFAQLGEGINQHLSKIEEPLDGLQERMQRLAPHHIFDGDIQHKIEYVDDPKQPGWQIATVNVGGKTYEVQRDEDGKLVPGPEVKQPSQEPASSQNQPHVDIQTEFPIGARVTSRTSYATGEIVGHNLNKNMVIVKWDSSNSQAAANPNNLLLQHSKNKEEARKLWEKSKTRKLR